MSILVVRHGLSEANDRTSAAFGSSDAELLPPGIDQAIEVGKILVAKYKIDPETKPVAASNMSRSQQTASVAGFRAIQNYDVLNEVDVPKTLALREALDRQEIIAEAREAAAAVLASPPEEGIWFTHGYLIAALCVATEMDTSGLRFIPRFGEIRELPI